MQAALREDEKNCKHLEDNESDASGAKEDEVAPEGLVYSNDDVYLFEVDPKSEDETQTSFPNDLRTQE